MIGSDPTNFSRDIVTMACHVDWTALCTMILTLITGYYAWRTTHILNATTRQATAAEMTLALLIKDRGERLEQLKAPINACITESLAVVENWTFKEFDLASQKALLDSSELEAANLAELAVHGRAHNYAVGRALEDVDAQIINARAAIDVLNSTKNPDNFLSRTEKAKDAIRALRNAWLAAEKAVRVWQ